MMDRQLAEATVIVTDHGDGAAVRHVTARLIARLFRTEPVILTEGAAGDGTPPSGAPVLRMPGSAIPLSSLDGEIIAEIGWTGAAHACSVDVLIELRVLDRTTQPGEPAVLRRRFTLESATGPRHRATAAIPIRDLAVRLDQDSTTWCRH